MALEGKTTKDLQYELFGQLAETKIKPLQYYKIIRGLNSALQEDFRARLGEVAGSCGGIATLITPGSDGRLEKGSMASPIEIIALVSEEVNTDQFREMLVDVVKGVATTRVSDVVEIKTPSSELSRFNYNGHNSYHPSRVAESRLLYGSKRAVQEAKQNLADELIALPTKKSAKKSMDLVRDSLKTTIEGKNRIGQKDAMHYDFEKGIIFYDPDADKNQKSFKIGPLRLVQNVLFAEQVKYTRREKDREFLSVLRQGLVPRLNQLFDDKMLNLTKESTVELAEHYAFFLHLYHRSEQRYERLRQRAIQLTPSEMEEVAKRIQSMIEITERLQIGKQPAKPKTV